MAACKPFSHLATRTPAGREWLLSDVRPGIAHLHCDSHVGLTTKVSHNIPQQVMLSHYVTSMSACNGMCPSDGNWGVEAQKTFSYLVSLLAASHSVSKSKATADIYGHLNLTLTRSVARAILARGIKVRVSISSVSLSFFLQTD